MTAPTMHVRPVTMRLLLVDDDGMLRAAVQRALRVLRPEWEVSTAANCHDALAQLESYGPTPPDVVIADLGLQEESGAEVLRRAEELTPSAIRMLLTGDSRGGHPAELHTEHVMRKPISARDLIQAVERVRPAASPTHTADGQGGWLS